MNSSYGCCCAASPMCSLRDASPSDVPCIEPDDGNDVPGVAASLLGGHPGVGRNDVIDGFTSDQPGSSSYSWEPGGAQCSKGVAAFATAKTGFEADAVSIKGRPEEFEEGQKRHRA